MSVVLGFRGPARFPDTAAGGRVVDEPEGSEDERAVDVEALLLARVGSHGFKL